MAVAWTDDPSAFAARDWSSLVDADPDGTVFHRPGFLKPYWEELGSGALQLAFVEEDGAPVAVAALEIDDGVLRWLGGTEVTDYMGPVGLPEARDLAAKELMVALAARDDWTRADLGGLPVDGSWLPALEEAAADAGLGARRAGGDVAPFLELPATFDAYLAALPGKLRHEIRRKERRLREALPEARMVEATPESLAGDLDRFVELHRASPDRKGRFMLPGVELLFRRLAAELGPSGTFRLVFLEGGGDRLAAAVAFRDGDALRLYNSAYDRAHARLAPGMVLVGEVIRDAIGEGGRVLDLLRGDLPYKQRFGPSRRRLARLLLGPR